MSDTIPPKDPKATVAPLPKPSERKRFADYSMADVEENLRQQRELKKSKYDPEMLEKYMESYKIGLLKRVEQAIAANSGKLKPADSIVVSSKEGLKSVPVEDTKASPQQTQEPVKLDESIKERMQGASGRGLFKDRFPSVTKLVNMLATKQGDDKKEMVRQTEQQRKLTERNEKVGFALEAISKEQQISVKLLRVLLDIVKRRTEAGNAPLGGGGPGLGGASSRLPSVQTMLYGGLALGAAASIGVGMLRDSGALTNPQETDATTAMPYGTDVDAMGLRPPPEATQTISGSDSPGVRTQSTERFSADFNLSRFREVDPEGAAQYEQRLESRTRELLGSREAEIRERYAERPALREAQLRAARSIAALQAQDDTLKEFADRVNRSGAGNVRVSQSSTTTVTPSPPAATPSQPAPQAPAAGPRISSGQPSRITGPRSAPVLGEGGDLAAAFPGAGDQASTTGATRVGQPAASGTDQPVSEETRRNAATEVDRALEKYNFTSEQYQNYEEFRNRLIDHVARSMSPNDLASVRQARIDNFVKREVLRQARQSGNFTQDEMMVANQPVFRDRPLTEDQIRIMTVAIGMGNRNVYPDWLLQKYESQRSQASAQAAPESAPPPPMSPASSVPPPPMSPASSVPPPPMSPASSAPPPPMSPASSVPPPPMSPVSNELRGQAEQEVDRTLQRMNYTREQNDDFDVLRERLVNQALTDRDIGIDPSVRQRSEGAQNTFAGVSDAQARDMAFGNVIQQHRLNRAQQSSEVTPAGAPPSASTAGTETNNLVTRLSSAEQQKEAKSSFPSAVKIQQQEDAPKTTDAVVNEVVTKQEIISKELENRPDMFSNRTLMIRARNIKFKGDEIEFEQAAAAPQKVGGQAPTGSMSGGGGSPLAQMFSGGAPAASGGSGGGAAMEGGGGQIPAPSEEAATKDLKFAPGVDKRIQKDIAEKVKETESASGKSLTITSGFRDPARNAAAGGARNSAHTSGKAVDIQFRGNVEDTVNLIQKASASGIGGIGVYRPGFVHLDTGPKRVWGPDYTARSIPDWAKEALQAHMTGQSAQTQASGGGESGGGDATMVSSDSASSTGAPAGDAGGGASSPTATPAPAAPTTGAEVAQASVGNEVATRTPEPPAVTEMPADGGSPTSPLQNPTYSHSMNDPGPVEPADAAQRYAMLFNMAA